MAAAEGYEDYVRRQGAPLVRYAYLVCGDRALAQDLTQEVLIKVIKHWDRIADSNPDAYLRRSLINEYRSWRRRRGNQEQASMSAPVETVDPIADIVEHRWMWSVICELPRRQRAVLVLRYYEDWSDQEIARCLGCREATVRSLASRALQKLRTQPDIHPRALAPSDRESHHG